ncbi:MAG: S8 family serine peptidase [Bacteroidales bacterium]|nr:S8 family serine peptidase [Bacteroidales bacterium]
MKSTLKKSILLLFVMVVSAITFAQTTTNKEALEQIAREQDAEWQQMKIRAEQYSEQHNIPIFRVLDNGTIIQLVDVVDNKPVYYKTDNDGAAITTRAYQLWEGGSVGVIIDGEGYDKVGIWDGGKVRTTHQEFNNTGTSRIILSDNASALSAHSTHVSGTIIAGGVNAGAKGMAHKGQLKTYDWNSVESEMSTAATNGMEISNHSWGMLRGWDMGSGTWEWYGNEAVSPTEDYLFGFYNSQARTWDMIAYQAPYFLMVKSSGNDRGEGPGNAGQGGNPEKDGGTDGYDCIGGSGISKNILTIGAVNEVLNYTGPSSVTMSSFSDWGPADDGRIKPDVVGKGVNTYSSTSNSNTSYASYDGTSMSAPNVTGTMVLLQQLYQQTHDNVPMRASTLKGLVIHTADECGTYDGPDYKFGWGLVNAERAGNIILEDDVMQNSIDEITLENGGTYTRQVMASGTSPFWVTISWTDPHGTIPTASLNPRTPIIKHDLDLQIEDEQGNVYYPYKLDPLSPSSAATTDSKNFVDNVEKVYIAAPTAGTYTITVNHEGTLSPNQIFSIILSGLDEFSGVPECTSGMTNPLDGSVDAFLNHLITWTPASFASSYDIYFGTDGNGTSIPTNIKNGENIAGNSFRYNMQPLTTYYLAVLPRNSSGVNDACNTIYSFTTMDAIDQYPYFQGVEDVETPAMPDYWQGLDFGSMHWASTNLLGFTGTNSFACYTTNGSVAPLNNYLISPPFMVEPGKEYLFSYAYRGFVPSSPESLRVLWGTAADTSLLTNLIFSDPANTSTNWIEKEHLIVPAYDGHIFFAWHANTASGMGQFIDDVMIEDWGPVGVKESAEKQVRVTYKDSKITVNSQFVLDNVNLTVTNSTGQTIMNSNITGLSNEFNINLTSGYYIIKLQGNDLSKTTRVLVP